ncbi:MAG: hypothetical protein F2754_09080 [Actinobacteria bacterium]|nr:hypothetical protein [Actinomycetota bacterium]MSW92534.1 hypothetical protein [Actinomycetota bacterium]MSX87524.1 hypothetical protein [Actinomycetota bacterium]MSY72806.1 hypothetical protein [Actinomycetota bacterium]
MPSGASTAVGGICSVWVCDPEPSAQPTPSEVTASSNPPAAVDHRNAMA